MVKEKSKLEILTNGIIKENPVFILLLGTCPSLAVSKTAYGALGMGLATLGVLIFSNFLISLLRNIIPDKVRIPSYIVIFAGFVTVMNMLIKAYLPALNEALGIYLPLITVNCIVLSRAEIFASKNKVLNSILDGIGAGLGFTLALFIVGSLREFIGAGTWMGIELTNNLFSPLAFLTTAPGGFFAFAIIIAIVNKITHNKNNKEIGCDDCLNAEQNTEKVKEVK